jgi:hypothetical protein
MGTRSITRTRWSFSSALVALVALGPLVAPPARAQQAAETTRAAPTPEDVESAKVAFTEGLALRKKGDEKGALARFRAAYALVPTPITGLEVGRSLLATGQVAEGRTLLLEVSRMPKKPNESDKAEEARHEAADLADKARAQLATLTVETDASQNPTVTIDGVVIPAAALQAPRVLDPGHHVVEVHANGKSGHAEVDLAPGEAQQIHVSADHADHPPPPPPPPPIKKFRYHPGLPFWVSVIATGAGLVVGVGTGVGALAVTGRLSGECPGKTCPPSAYGDLDTSLALGWTSTIAFAVAGAGAVASVITFFASGRHEAVPAPKTAHVHVVPGLGSVWLEGTF